MDDIVRSLTVGGLTPFSAVDYPGHLAAVVFCQGCPWRCSYCHNPHLHSPHSESAQPWPEIRDWLDSRRGLLDAVVFSGGEPLLQRGLDLAMFDVSELGYRVGLHTTGMYPERLKAVLPLVDWIGFDIKAPFDEYPKITGAPGGQDALRALTRLMASDTAFEVRCTVDEGKLDADDMARMAKQLAELGIDHVLLQACRDAQGRCRPVAPGLIAAMSPWITHVEQRFN